MPKIDPRDVLPQSNLPVPSVPWGRAMQARLQGVEERVLIDKQDIDGQNRTTAAQLAAISEQLGAISEQQSILSEQQSILSEQQSELSDAQSDITDLLGRVVTSRVATGQTSNYSVSTTLTTRGTANIPVPSGYNRAAVIGIASSVAEVSAPSGNDFLELVVRIAGDDGTPIFSEGTSLHLGSEFPNVTTSHARVINDPSGSISVQGRVRSLVNDWPSSPSNGTVVTATATFYNE